MNSSKIFRKQAPPDILGKTERNNFSHGWRRFSLGSRYSTGWTFEKHKWTLAQIIIDEGHTEVKNICSK